MDIAHHTHTRGRSEDSSCRVARTPTTPGFISATTGYHIDLDSHADFKRASICSGNFCAGDLNTNATTDGVIRHTVGVRSTMTTYFFVGEPSDASNDFIPE